jgi:uncharacterized protein YbjT (DUF2867 family)
LSHPAKLEMSILVTGASGLIGSSLCARLAAEGHHVVGVLHRSRTDSLHHGSTFVLDMVKAVRPEVWIEHLAGVEAVVNCAGVLQDSPRESIREVHATGASALFLACEKVGVRKVIHFSAIGVNRDQPSTFSISKLAGDEALMARNLDWIILRPSVVLGRPVFGASALMRGLAVWPWLPLMPNTGRLQVVQLDDVVETVVFFLNPNSPSKLALDLAGPEALSMAELIAAYRRWFGWREAKFFELPRWAAQLLYRMGDFAGWLGWRPAMRTNAAKEITRGAVGDPTEWSRLTGIVPETLKAALSANPASVQDRWFAKLYFVKPAMFFVLSFFWIATGVISLTTGWHNGVALLRPTAVSALAEPAVIAGALADIGVGAAIAWRPSAPWGLWGAIAISFFYLITGTILRPDLWNEPLGPFLKILPILVLHFAALAILVER